jgi:hypothetical protein
MHKHLCLLLSLLCMAPLGAQSAAGAYGNGQSIGQGNHQTASATCPWLTAGTAAAALGGDVASTVSVTSLTEGTCRFARRDQPMEFLEIRVSAAPLAACPAGSPPLEAIGNEADWCRVSAPHGMAEEMASGRVRDLHFTVVSAGRAQKKTAKPSDPDDTLTRIADEVAGNLF